MFRRAVDTVRRRWDDLSDRERLLAMIFAGILLALVTVVPFFYLFAKNRIASSENSDISDLLAKIEASREKIMQQAQEKKSLERRYANKAPDLSAFLEENGKKVGVPVDRTRPEPTATIGKYVRRSVRADLPNVELGPAIKLMAKVETSRYPVVLSKVEFTHNQLGENKFAVRLGVVAFDKEDNGRKSTERNK